MPPLTLATTHPTPALTSTPKLAARSWSITSSLLAIGMLTLVVKLVAFGKDLVVAHQFGTSDEMDAFLIAFLIPSLIPMVFAQSIPIALLPAYTQVRDSDGTEAANRLAVQSIWLYGLGLLIVMVATYLARDGIIAVLASKFSAEKKALTANLFTHLLPFGFLYGLSFGLVTWLQAHKRFVLTSLTPALMPLCTLGFMLVAGPVLGVWSFVYGTTVGSALLLGILWWTAHRDGLRGFGRLGSLNPATLRVGRESLSLLAGGMLLCGLPVLDQVMAGWLAPGSVAVLSYSEKICSVALSLIAGSVAQGLYPYFAEQVSRGDWAGLKSTTWRYSWLIIGGSVPVVLAFWWLAPWMVQHLFERGAFDLSDTERVADVLRFHALQIPFYVAAVLASRVILALRVGSFLFYTSLMNLALNFVLNLLFMPSLGVAGLALATAGVYLASAVMLYSYLLVIVPRRIAATQLNSALPACPLEFNP